MARKKRLCNEMVLAANKTVLAPTVANNDAKVYSVGLYVRLSVEDSGKMDGYSLENQIAFLKDYISGKEEFNLYKIYIDNGETGVNFERPKFEELLADVRSGLVDCIIVKDLSRFGRNYLEAGDYLEQIFPYLKVRFISVLDEFDSNSIKASDDIMLMALKNIINDSYAKDISKKIKSSFLTKQKKGMYLGTYPPYGYFKDPEVKGHLIVDETTAPIVHQIFVWVSEKKSYGWIAKTLNELEVLAPYRYFYSIGIVKDKRHAESVWTRTIIRRLIERRYYIGDMESGKEETFLAEGIQNRKIPKDQWIVVEGTHEPIISKMLFYVVQARIDEVRANHATIDGSYQDFEVDNYFRGLIRCGICDGSMKMVRTQRTNKSGSISRRVEYVCGNHDKYGHQDCKNLKIKKSDLDTAVLGEIQSHIKMFVSAEQVIQKLNRNPRINVLSFELESQIQTKKKRMTKINQMSTGLYEDFKDEIIDEAEYLSMRKAYYEECEKLRAEIGDLQERRNKYSIEYEASGELKSTVSKFMDVNKLSHELVQAFIKQIVVYDENRIKIVFNFQDEFQSVIREMEQRKGEVRCG